MNSDHAVLILNTYAGRREYPILIIGETPKKFRVKILSQTNVILPGRRIANYGDIILVPKPRFIGQINMSDNWANPFFDELLNRGKTKVNVTDDEFNAVLQDFNEQKEKINAEAINNNKIDEILQAIRECKDMLNALLERRK